MNKPKKVRAVGTDKDYQRAYEKISQFQRELVECELPLDVSSPIHQCLAQAYQIIRSRSASISLQKSFKRSGQEK